jgi:hypothetical protein
MVVWFAILVLAALNGALRDLIMAPRIGDTIARAISTVVLCGLILLVAWLSIRWIGSRTGQHALIVGVLWVVLTLTFELGSGLYAGKPWAVMLEDYNLLRGRLWVLVPIVTFFAPVWAARVRGLP